MLVLGYALPLLAKEELLFRFVTRFRSQQKTFCSLKEDMLNVLLIL